MADELQDEELTPEEEADFQRLQEKFAPTGSVRTATPGGSIDVPSSFDNEPMSIDEAIAQDFPAEPEENLEGSPLIPDTSELPGAISEMFTPRHAGTFTDEQDASKALEALGLSTAGKAIEDTPLDVNLGTAVRQAPRSYGTYALGGIGAGLAGLPGAVGGGMLGNYLFGLAGDTADDALSNTMKGDKYKAPPEPMTVGNRLIESFFAGVGPGMQRATKGAFPSGIRTRAVSQEQFSRRQMKELAAKGKQNAQIGKEYNKNIAAGGADALAAAIGVDDAAYRKLFNKPPGEAVGNILSRGQYVTVNDLQDGVRNLLHSEEGGGVLDNAISATAKQLDHRLGDSMEQVSRNTIKETPVLGKVSGKPLPSGETISVPVKEPTGIAQKVIDIANDMQASGDTKKDMVAAAHDLSEQIMKIGGESGHVGVDGMRDVLKLIREFRYKRFGGQSDAGEAFAKLVANPSYASARETLEKKLGNMAGEGHDVGRLARKYLDDIDYLHDVMSMRDFLAQSPRRESLSLMKGRDLEMQDLGKRTAAGMSLSSLRKLGLGEVTPRTPQNYLNTTYGSKLEGLGGHMPDLPEGLPLQPSDVASPSAMLTLKGMGSRALNIGADSMKAAYVSRDAVARHLLQAGVVNASQATRMSLAESEDEMRQQLADIAAEDPVFAERMQKEGIVFDPKVTMKLQQGKKTEIINNPTPNNTSIYRDMKKIAEGGIPR